MKKKTKDKWKTVRILVVIVVLAGMLIGFYYYISHRTESDSGKNDVTVSQTQKVLLRNLETGYPPSPREVIKYYSEITQCFYNEEHTDKELEKLALQIQKLYADELISNQTQEEYLSNLKKDIETMKADKCEVSSFSPSASTDVEYYTEDGYNWAKLYCIYNIRQETKILTTNEVFLLQQDADKHWKIYGWKIASK